MTDVYRPTGWEAKNGRVVDPERCAAQVQSNFQFYQCTRKGRFEEDGHRWCKQHLPSEERKRDEEARKKMRAESAANSARWHKPKIADAAIAYFRQEGTFEDIEAAVNEYERLRSIAASLNNG